jgi:hypothetical protein
MLQGHLDELRDSIVYPGREVMSRIFTLKPPHQTCRRLTKTMGLQPVRPRLSCSEGRPPTAHKKLLGLPGKISSHSYLVLLSVSSSNHSRDCGGTQQDGA